MGNDMQSLDAALPDLSNTDFGSFDLHSQNQQQQNGLPWFDTDL